MSEENKKEKHAVKAEEKLDIPDTLPVLVLRDIVVFPYMIVPLYVGRSKSKKGVENA